MNQQPMIPPAIPSPNHAADRGALREVRYFLAANKLAAAGLVTILLLVLLAVFAPLIAPYPADVYQEVHLEKKFLPPRGSTGSARMRWGATCSRGLSTGRGFPFRSACPPSHSRC